ncbi:hypothetical protein T10_10787 [Trichinella papuae]|uniref:Uncharacterized protein n=1 Tax=Trichinella papuae TaxID=268474 RepID=A0A0V1MTC6_9BILA|nr:hypothetical protein T10_10787 [Trichinella papuae]
MTSIDQKKSGNYNEPGRTLHESVFVEILAQTLNHDALIVGTIESGGRFYVALNCSHYNRIMIKRLRHYLDE